MWYLEGCGSGLQPPFRGEKGLKFLLFGVLTLRIHCDILCFAVERRQKASKMTTQCLLCGHFCLFCRGWARCVPLARSFRGTNVNVGLTSSLAERRRFCSGPTVLGRFTAPLPWKSWPVPARPVSVVDQQGHILHCCVYVLGDQNITHRHGQNKG